MYWDMIGEDEEEEENMEFDENVELGEKVVHEEPLSAVKHRRGPALKQEPREHNVSVTGQKITIKKGNVLFRFTRACVTNVVSTNIAWALHCIAHRHVAGCNGAHFGKHPRGAWRPRSRCRGTWRVPTSLRSLHRGGC